MQPLLQILENILLLSLLGLGFYVIESQRGRISGSVSNLLHGLSFGLIAFLVTTTHVEFGDGATVDARAAPVILAGYVGGPIAAVIAAVFGGLARGLIGSHFAFSGVIVYFVYATMGSAFWAFWRSNDFDFANPWRIAVMCFASCMGAAAMFVLISPVERALLWLQNDLPYIFAANTLGIVFAMIVLGVASHLLRKSQEVDELYETLSLAKRAGGFGIWDYNTVTGTLNWDERSRDLFGIDSDSFAGRFEDWAERVHPEDLPKAQEAFWRALKDSDTYHAEYRVLRPDGKQVTIQGNAVLLRDAQGGATRVVGTNLDVTKIRAAEAKLREAQNFAVQAQKFENIGKLTGGVAHDFNNLLAVIMGNLELASDELKRQNPDKTELFTLLDSSLEATRRGASLTSNMLAYARKARLNPEALNLNDTVRETESWMRRTIPSKIEIELTLQEDLWTTLVDKSSVQSALINLLVNARDAFDGSGKVNIETANIEIDAAFIAERDEDITPGKYVMLAVSDNGRGIDESIIEHIFDPFFTTKNVGEGSGLGLSMVQGFVKQSGGAIRVYSVPGEGTSFTMYFPAVAGTMGPKIRDSQNSQEVETSEHSRRRLLVVEDREEVLLMLEKTLTSAGYTVVTATNGDEGFQIYKRDPNFDLIMTDVIMPGKLQGPAMAQKIREVSPDMKFIFLSGYTSEATVGGNELDAEDLRLMKPVSRSDLLAAVAKAVGTK